MGSLTLLLKTGSLAEEFEMRSKENGSDRNDKGAVYAGVQAGGGGPALGSTHWSIPAAALAW